MPSKTLFAAILLKALLKAFMAFLLGCFFSVFSVGWSMHLFTDNLSEIGGMGGHGGGLALLLGLIFLPLVLFKLEPWSAALLFASLFLPCFYAFLAWKIGTGALLQLVYVDYLSDSLRHFVGRSSSSVSQHLDMIKKSKYVQDLSNFQQKILYWGFKKIPFDLDSKKELELKFEEKIDHPFRLAKRTFWIVFALHAALLMLASWLNHG